MTGLWAPPTLKVEISGDLGMGDDYASATWVDVSSRVISFSMDRGKQDRTAEYETGTCSITLNNDDRMLDPAWSSSLTYSMRHGAAVRVTAEFDGTSYPVFLGRVGPELFRCSPFGRGAVSVCQVDAFDFRGAMGSLLEALVMATSPYDAMVESLEPDDRWRSWVSASVLATNDTIANEYGVAPWHYPSTLLDNGGGELATVSDALAPGDDTPSIFTYPGMRLTMFRDGLFPSGAISNYTLSFIFTATTNASVQSLARINSTYDGTGNDRWQVYIDTSGAVILRVRNNAGTSIETRTVTANPAAGSGGRWDDGVAHHCTIRVRSGSPEVKVWVDGQTATSTHASIPNPYSTGWLVLGSTVAAQQFADVSWWQSAVSATDISHLQKTFLGTYAPYVGDSFTDRVLNLYSLAGWTVTGDTLAEIHEGASDDVLWGLGAMGSFDRSLLGELANTADGSFGAMWATKGGPLRVRTSAAMAEAGYATQYATSQANLTDEASPAGSPTPVRRGPVQFSGFRQDRVIDSVEIVTGYDDGGDVPATTLRYLRRLFSHQEATRTLTFTQKSVSNPSTIAYGLLTKYGSPTQEIEEIELMPWGDDDATTVLLGLELEQVVTVTDSPPTGSPTSDDYRVIGESWDWQDGTAWTVTLRLIEA